MTAAVNEGLSVVGAQCVGSAGNAIAVFRTDTPVSTNLSAHFIQVSADRCW